MSYRKFFISILTLLSISCVDAGMRIDAGAGSHSLVSRAAMGSGPIFAVPRDIAVEADGSLVVVDALLNVIMRVDHRTGNRSIVSGCPEALLPTCRAEKTIGRGPPFLSPASIEVETDGSLVVLDGEFNEGRVIRVNPRTGDRSIVSLLNNTFFLSLGSIAVGMDKSLFMTDRALRLGVVIGQLTPVTGHLSSVSGDSGGVSGQLEGIAVEADGSLVLPWVQLTSPPGGGLVSAAGAALVRVDPRTGNRVIISGCPEDVYPNCIAADLVGSGPPFRAPNSIAVEGDGSIIVGDDERVGDQELGAIFRVNPRTGDRVIVSGCLEDFSPTCEAIGNGPSLQSPLGIAVEADGSFVVVDLGLTAVVRVDSSTGNRTIVSR